MKRLELRYLAQADVVIVSLFALAALMTVVLELPSLLRIALALPLVLFAPGYSLSTALLPGRSLEAIERVLVSLGLSIVTTILVGLVLAFASVPLDAISWAVALAGLTIIGSVVTVARRVRARIESPRLYRPVVPLGGAVMILLASVIVADVLLGARLVALRQDRPVPEQLWMIAGDDPTEVRLGMRGGPGGGRYTIRVSSAGEVIHSFAPQLTEGEEWETVVSVRERRQRPLVARLYEGGTELRFVVLQPSP